MAFSPRKRAKSLVPTIKVWPYLESKKPILLGFAGYKAGMISLTYVENDKNSINYGKEVFTPATVVEVPPLSAIGIIGYHIDEEKNSLSVFTTATANSLPPDLKRRIVNVSNVNAQQNLEKLRGNIEKLEKIRVLFATQPRQAGIRKKKAEIFEVEVGGKASTEEKLEYAASILGKDVPIQDVYAPGETVDVIAVTKGKGFQGPVKRWGIKILTPKARKGKRKPGTLGPWRPHSTMYTVPGAGQMGFHRRTMYGVRILAIKTLEEGSAAVGVPFHKYGVLKNSYALLKGSTPGSTKRLVRLRYTVRPRRVKIPAPEIVHVKKGV